MDYLILDIFCTSNKQTAVFLTVSYLGFSVICSKSKYSLG